MSDPKRDLRRRMKSTRMGFSEAERAARSLEICERVARLELFRDSVGVALYWPLLRWGEVDLRSLDTRARAQGKRVYYPFMVRGDPSGMGFRRVDDAGSLRDRGAGFSEPPPEAPEAQSGEIELVVTPALAATPDGYRLGYGSGFYDVTLARLCPPARSVVVAYAFQLLADLPIDEHDVAGDVVMTDAECFDPGGVLGS